MVSGINRMVLQCTRGSRLCLAMSESNGYQFWRRERNFIVSEKSHGYLGVDNYDNTLLSIYFDGADGCKNPCTCAIEKVVSYIVCTDVCQKPNPHHNHKL